MVTKGHRHRTRLVTGVHGNQGAQAPVHCIHGSAHVSASTPSFRDLRGLRLVVSEGVVVSDCASPGMVVTLQRSKSASCRTACQCLCKGEIKKSHGFALLISSVASAVQQPCNHTRAWHQSHYVCRVEKFMHQLGRKNEIERNKTGGKPE